MFNLNFHHYGPVVSSYPLQVQEGPVVPAKGHTTTQYVIQVPSLYNWASDRASFLSWLSPIPLKKFAPPAVTWRVVEEDQRQVELAVTVSMADLERDRKRRGLRFWKKWPFRNPLKRAISKGLKAYQEQQTRLAIVEKRAISRARESERRQMKCARELSLASPHVQTEILGLLNLETAQPKDVSDLRTVLERIMKPEHNEQLARERERKKDLEDQIARERERKTDLEEQLTREQGRKTDLEKQLAHARGRNGDLEEQLTRIRLEADLAFHRPPAYKKV